MADLNSVMQKIIKFQQGELDAVVLYRGLADKMDNEEDKKLLLSIAADEGKHAAILKKITNADLKANDGLKKTVLFLYKIVGKKFLFKIMAKSESIAAKGYKPFFNEYPQLREIADDELRHGELLR